MKRDNWLVRISNILTPIVIYLGISFVIQIIVTFAASLYLQLNMGVSSATDYERYAEELLKLINKIALPMTGISAVISFPFIMRMYKNDGKRLVVKQPDISPVLYAVIPLLGICSCFFLNGILSISGLAELLQEGYEDTAESIYSSPLWMQYLIAALVIPVIEELIFRGIIFRRMRTYSIFSLAALVSSVIFGIYHMNIIQFIYATCLGLVLAYVYEKYRTIIASIIMHAAANAFSILITTNQSVAELLSASEKRLMISIAVSLLGTILCLAVIRNKVSFKRAEE